VREKLSRLEQHLKTCRTEVAIIGERLRDAKPMHNLKRYVIDNAGLRSFAALISRPGPFNFRSTWFD